MNGRVRSYEVPHLNTAARQGGTMKRKRTWEHWAVVSKLSGRLLRGLDGHVAIWAQELRAIVDCPHYGRVTRVSIRELPRKRR